MARSIKMLQELRPGRLFSLRGRRGRLSYFLTPFVVSAAIPVAVALAVGVARALDSEALAMVLMGMVAVMAAAVVWSLFVAAVQRLHDLDRSGWWVLLPLALAIPQVAMAAAGQLELIVDLLDLNQAAIALCLLLAPGTSGPNRFGPPPTWPGGPMVAATA
jgi:uncharacterized membrane protein YhaH (DUF805 family)